MAAQPRLSMDCRLPLGWSPAEQVQQLQAMKATGITSVRVDANWYGGQPDGPDSYDWTSLDQVVASIQEVGLSADLIIDGCPPWAAVSGAQGNQFAQPASPAAFANWAAAVAKRYDSKGAKYFEIWKEPNNPTTQGRHGPRCPRLTRLLGASWPQMVTPRR